MWGLSAAAEALPVVAFPRSRHRDNREPEPKSKKIQQGLLEQAACDKLNHVNFAVMSQGVVIEWVMKRRFFSGDHMPAWVLNRARTIRLCINRSIYRVINFPSSQIPVHGNTSTWMSSPFCRAHPRGRRGALRGVHEGRGDVDSGWMTPQPQPRPRTGSQPRSMVGCQAV